ncbi:hypothetical protein BS17DRAFT_325415 [Gyrodon lividus]|nr:hypothetical protein BS17DRAFT_325415 [Gyrodon lividus]
MHKRVSLSSSSFAWVWGFLPKDDICVSGLQEARTFVDSGKHTTFRPSAVHEVQRQSFHDFMLRQGNLGDSSSSLEVYDPGPLGKVHDYPCSGGGRGNKRSQASRNVCERVRLDGGNKRWRYKSIKVCLQAAAEPHSRTRKQQPLLLR